MYRLLIFIAFIASFNTYAEDCSQLAKKPCEESVNCQVAYWMCDYVPKGKTFAEVCPNGGKGWNCVKKPKAVMPEPTSTPSAAEKKEKFRQYRKSSLQMLAIRLKSKLLTKEQYDEERAAILKAKTWDELLDLNMNKLKK